MKTILRSLGAICALSFSLTAAASVCGLEGSIKERIQDCSYFADSHKGPYVVVSRLSNGKEIYKDMNSGLIWSARLEGKFSQFKAIDACRTRRSELAGISEVSWGLPTADEFSAARKNGLKSAFSVASDKDWFWSETPVPFDGFVAYIFSGISGDIGYHSRNSEMAVRCVGR